MNCLKNDIESIIEKIGNTPDKLIEILIEVQRQSEENYISKDALKIISKELKISLSKAYGVASFYSMLSTKKRGRYVIQICNSAPCYMNGGKQVKKYFEDILGITVGEMTDDGLFSLEFTGCIGTCDKAPAVKINDKVYGNLNKEKVEALVDSIRKEEEVCDFSF